MDKKLTNDDVRAAGGIVHKDGNIFFKNVDVLNNYLAERASNPASSDLTVVEATMDYASGRLKPGIHLAAERVREAIAKSTGPGFHARLADMDIAGIIRAAWPEAGIPASPAPVAASELARRIRAMLADGTTTHGALILALDQAAAELERSAAAPQAQAVPVGKVIAVRALEGEAVVRMEHRLNGHPSVDVGDILYTTPPAAAAAPSVQEALQWAVSRWHAEVANRPMVNVYRLTLDETWRQVIRHLGGDPDVLLPAAPSTAATEG